MPPKEDPAEDERAKATEESQPDPAATDAPPVETRPESTARRSRIPARRSRSVLDPDAPSPPKPRMVEVADDFVANHRSYPPYEALQMAELTCETKERARRKAVESDAEELLRETEEQLSPRSAAAAREDAGSDKTPTPAAAQEDAAEAERLKALSVVNAVLRTDVLSQKLRFCAHCGQRVPAGDEYMAHATACVAATRAAATRLGIAYSPEDLSVPPGAAGQLSPAELAELNAEALKQHLASLQDCERCGERLPFVELEQHLADGTC